MAELSEEDTKQAKTKQDTPSEDSRKSSSSHHKRSGSASSARKPPLHRNNACLSCRRKKRKCDAIHPVCTPCMNSAKLYQEEPSCEWASHTPASRSDDGSAKPEDASSDISHLLQQQLSSSSASLPPGFPPLPTPAQASLNPNISSDTSFLYSTYDPSYGTYNVNLDNTQAQDGSNASSLPSMSNAAGGSGTGGRKNLKRDNNTAEVDALQSRIAELEAKLQAVQASVLPSTSQATSSYINAPMNNQIGQDLHLPFSSTTSSSTRVHFPEQLPHLHQSQQQQQGDTSNGPGTGTSTPMGGRSGQSSSASSVDFSHLNHSKSSNASRQGTSSVSPFSSGGLPTPPPLSTSVSNSSDLGSAAAAGLGQGTFPPSPADNAGQGGGSLDFGNGFNGNNNMNINQIPTASAQSQQGFGQKPTNYYTKSPLAQSHDQKWNMAGLPGYLNTTPSGSGSQSPYTPGGLLWNQWPADLPQIEIVKALAGTALAMISDTLFLLPADSVFRSLALPPTDPRFPSTALLHALCALGATTFPLPPEARGYWQEAPTASAYHFRQSKKHLQTFNASQVLDDLRAAVLLVIYSFAAEQFIDVWQLVGMSCRGLPATGLNHVQNHSALPSTRMGTTPGHFLRKPTYLSPPSDDYEVFYRSTTMWMAFANDVWMGACSGWAMAIDLQDITTLLPVWPSDTTPLDVVLNQPSLDPHSQLFFTSHLDSPMISLHLSIKAMVLMRRVVDFLQRSTAPDSVINLEAKKLIRASPAFVSLTETIAGFQQNFPDKARYHLQTLPSGKLDSNLLNSHLIPNTAILLLFEPFIYDSEDEGFYTASMAAANRILQITQSVYAHSKDAISMYYTQINYCWMVCNRTLIRAMRFREDAGDQEGAKALRSSIEFLLARNSTLAAQSPLVCSCLGMIENLIKDETPWHRQ